MKRKTNCPNCGGPLPVDGLKCEFCGTRVIDLTMIDFDCQEPTMFILKLPKYINVNGNMYLSMWAKPQLDSFVQERNDIDVYGGPDNNVVLRVPQSPEITFEMSLHPCRNPYDNKKFFTIIKED